MDGILTSRDLETQAGASRAEQPTSAQLPPPATRHKTRRIDRYVLPHAPRGPSACAFTVDGKAHQFDLFDGVFDLSPYPERDLDMWRAALVAAGFDDESYEVLVEEEPEEANQTESSPTGDELGLDEGHSDPPPAPAGPADVPPPTEPVGQVLTAPAPGFPATEVAPGVKTEPVLVPSPAPTPPLPPPDDDELPAKVEFAMRHPDYNPESPHEGEYRVTVKRDDELEEDVVLEFADSGLLVTEDPVVAAALREQGFQQLNDTV